MTEVVTNVVLVVLLVGLAALGVVVYKLERRTGIPVGYGYRRMVRRARREMKEGER